MFSSKTLFASLLAVTVSGHAGVSEYKYKRPSYTKRKVTEQRKTFCTLLSFNGKSRNPSPTTCERAARRKSMEICNALKAQNLAQKSDDNRCQSFLAQKRAILTEDCSPYNDIATPLFVRVACPRFGDKGLANSFYDLIESIPYLDATGANRERWRASIAGTPFNYFNEGFWVYERETRCHGLLATSIVPLDQPTCGKYFGYEDDAVCNYLKTIFNDQWDLGCRRLRLSVLGLSHYHCKFRWNLALQVGQVEYCFTKGRGEDVSCDAVELICNANKAWDENDIALPPYFLSDNVIEQIFYFKANEESLVGSASSGAPPEFPKSIASLDFLQHAVRQWRGDVTSQEAAPEASKSFFQAAGAAAPDTSLTLSGNFTAKYNQGDN